MGKKRSLYELPGYAERGGYVYALLYSTGIVQVGRTADARAELTERRKAARALGIDLADWWVSKPHAEWVASERRLAEAVRAEGTRTGSGCYSGVDFAVLKEHAAEEAVTSTGAWAFGRRYRNRDSADGRDKRMAIAVRYRTGGMSAREIARRLKVSHTTIENDLARWEQVKESMPLEIIRLSRPMAIKGGKQTPSERPCLPGEIATDAGVIPLRRIG